MRNYVLEGKPLDDIYVFDIHGHLGQTKIIQTCDNEASDMIKKMDALGINSIAVSSNPALQSDPYLGNQITVDAAKKYPGRFYAYIVPTPYYEDFDFESYFKNPGVIGIKLHACEQLTALNNPAYIPALEYADKNGLPILFHTWEVHEVAHAVDIAKKYKNSPVIIGHSGFTGVRAKNLAVEACNTLENVFIDTAISSTYDGAIEWVVDKVGAEKVLFGTDFPFYDCTHNIGKLLLAEISDSDKLKIFGENAKKLLKNII